MLQDAHKALLALLLLTSTQAREITTATGLVPKTGSEYNIQHTLGSRAGGNLFHTFIKFDLATGETANFSGPADVTNILARVTGGRSFIDGRIKSSISGANLFLLNARGITFEQNATLDVTGSFSATTADVLKLADGGRFNALESPDDSLTAGALTAYGFLGKPPGFVGPPPGVISLQPRVKLAVGAGKTLTLAAGQLSILGGDPAESAVILDAPDSHVLLASVLSGDLKPGLTAGVKQGLVNMKNTKVNAGSASIRAGTLTASRVKVLTTGNLDLDVQGTATFENGTKLLSQTNGSKPSGNFSIRGGVVKLSDVSEIGTEVLAAAPASATAGKVSIVASDLSLRSGSSIRSIAIGGAGSAGPVDVRAGRMVVAGDGSPIAIGVFSTNADGATGNSGAVRVQAGSLDLLTGGAISADTNGKGRGGNVQVQAKDIRISAGAATVKTGIFSDSFAPGNGGDGGNVRVVADRLEIRDGGLISTKTIGPGRGGDTTVEVRELLITRGNTLSNTGIAADSATNATPGSPAAPAGPGGSVFVKADVARLLAGGQISASTETKGRGGNVTVEARELVLGGRGGGAPSTISADSLALAGAGGASGNVTVRAGDLRISNGARISATTFGAGAAGQVTVTARRAVLTSQPSDSFTGILAASASQKLPGAGGSVRADFGTLEIRGGAAIAGNTLGPGKGGDVIVSADSARLLKGGRISADTSGLGAGGSVALTARDLEISGGDPLRRSGIFSGSSAIGLGGMAGSVRVVAEEAEMLDGGTIAATSTSSGTGGSVEVAATRLSLDGASSIAASATGLGIAGSVVIGVEEPLLMLGASSVRTTSLLSDAGTVSITSASDIILREGSSVTVQASLGNAGRIALFATHMLYMEDSQLVAEAGMNGGDIFVDPEFIILDHSRISANAILTGGNILLSAQNFLPSETLVTATGSTAGTVQIAAPQLDLSGALAALSTQLVDASIRFQERCAMRLGADASTFLVLGRGAVEDFPGNPPLVISRPWDPKPAAPARAVGDPRLPRE